MAAEKFEVGDTVWRTDGFQEIRIESIDNRSRSAIISWMDQNSHRIVSPVPVALSKITKSDPHLSDTGPLQIPPLE